MTENKISLPLWGPYSKKYAGISAIAKCRNKNGIRFDLSVAPAVSAFDIRVPNVTLPSNYHPWLSSEDYSFYSFRYDLEWKDKVYADVSYTRLTDKSILVRTELVNNSDLIKNFVVNYFSSIEYPLDSYATLSLPKKCAYKNAVDYDTYMYNTTRPWDEQNADGRKKGEFIDKRFTNEKGLGDRAEKSLEFKEMLEKRTGLSVVMWDERLTTVEANRTLMEGKVRREDRSKYVDMLAAVYILQGYLDSKSFKL